MTHEELLAICEERSNIVFIGEPYKALRSVVELHSPDYDEVNGYVCPQCSEGEYWTPYPCITIQAIEKELG